jgi:hypothetical protein
VFIRAYRSPVPGTSIAGNFCSPNRDMVFSFENGVPI